MWLAKLARISLSTIDRLLAGERRIRRLRQCRNPGTPSVAPEDSVKVASEWDTTEVGNLQIDYVLHCGHSTGGQYLHTLSAADIATAWWEGEAITSRSQEATKEGMQNIRRRLPFGFGKCTRTTTAGRSTICSGITARAVKKRAR